MKRQNSPEKLDRSRTTPDVTEFFQSYFTAKSSHDLQGMMAHFSPQLATYSDAPMGWAVNGYDAVYAGYKMRMNQPADGFSYPTLIMGDITDGDGSALVAFTNTPGIVGDELHILSPIDIRNGTIVRQVDYWDSTAFDNAIYAEQRQAADRFPREYQEDKVGTSASPIIIDIANQLLAALAANDTSAAADLFDYDAVWEDMSLRVQVIGRAAIQRLFTRTLSQSPLGVGSRLRHIVGGPLGGSFEWHCAPQFEVDGVTCLMLDGDAQILRATTVYDSRQLGEHQRSALITRSTEP